MKLNNFKKKLICMGAADQFEAIKPIVENLGSRIDFLCDDTEGKVPPYPNEIEFIGGRAAFNEWFKGRNANDYGFVVAIGNPYGQQRILFAEFFKKFGIESVSFCDPSAIIEKNAQIGEGAQIMKQAMVSTLTRLGRQCIINTKALVEHHCNLGDGVELGPSATLCGRVSIQNFSWMGANSTILPRLNIAENNILGAGSVLTKNITNPDVVWAGNPASFLKNNLINKR